MIYNACENVVFDLTNIVVNYSPFPHFSATDVLPEKYTDELYNWFLTTMEWHLVETDFYEQYEFSLLHAKLPAEQNYLISETTFKAIELIFKEKFKVNILEIVDVVAHKLINSQHIGVHNDFIGNAETHRLVLHINPYWKEENGGYLMLFNSDKAEDVSKLIYPLNNTIFGFEISLASHHAVSRIYDFTRYTIVYTFKSL